MTRSQPTDSQTRPRRTARRLLAVSPITRRILAVNALALIILVAGLLYLGKYRDNLIDAEMDSLKTHAELFAVALGEGAVAAGGAPGEFLHPDAVVQMVRRLVQTTGTRARLFAEDGVLLADSRLILHPRGQVLIEELDTPGTVEEAFRDMMVFYETILRELGQTGRQAPRLDLTGHRASDFPEVARALKGEPTGFVREPKGTLELSVAVPVQRYKHILGALLLTRSGADIDDAMLEVRLNILGVFGVVLVITLLMSFYLASTIARPLHTLAEAAERVRHGHHRQHEIPEFKNREDDISELASALRDMTEALWTRMDAIERFAADVAHEIKNPLTSLQSAVETAARVQDPVMQKKLMVVIQDDVRRLDRLITDISDASRLDAELSKAEMTPVNLTAMLETLADMHAATAGADTPAIELSCTPGLWVMGIEDRLVQVFRNLIANAVSFSPKGGLITITARPDNTAAEITIEDDGPGIPPGKEAAIFDRFYTERPKGEAFGQHSGLGLSISKQIIDALGGTIRAENRMDDAGAPVGARFIVRLDRAETPLS